jgi:hypothetical protein
MKLNRILPVAGVLTLLAGAALAQVNIPAGAGAALAQVNIPAGAGAGVYRPPPGTQVGPAVNPPPAAAPTKSCSQQVDELGLRGTERQTFLDKCN